MREGASGLGNVGVYTTCDPDTHKDAIPLSPKRGFPLRVSDSKLGAACAAGCAYVRSVWMCGVAAGVLQQHAEAQIYVVSHILLKINKCDYFVCFDKPLLSV